MAAGPLEVGGARWWLAPGSDPDATGALLARALDALARGAAPVRRGRRKALYRLALAGPQPDHLLKVNDYAGAVSLARRLRASKARRELARAEGVARRGVPTPLPRAAGEVRRCRVRSCSNPPLCSRRTTVRRPGGLAAGWWSTSVAMS